MIDPEIAADMVAQIPGSRPVLAMRGTREGQHVKYAYRYEIPSPALRHISVSRRSTEDGITVYVNGTSVSGQPFPKGGLGGVRVLQFYPRGYEGKNGEKGLSTAAAGLPTLLPRTNDVYRLSVSNRAGLRNLLEWYALHNIEATPRVSDELGEAILDASRRGNTEEERTLRAIWTRRGQPAFREALLRSFEGKCCVTNCSLAGVLEAAHIVPHSEDRDFEASNGLLLRADVHTLFDIRLLSINDQGIVEIEDQLVGTEYEHLAGRSISWPRGIDTADLRQRLARRHQEFSNET